MCNFFRKLLLRQLFNWLSQALYHKNEPSRGGKGGVPPEPSRGGKGEEPLNLAEEGREG
jgi:hypothetical protein